MNRRKAIFSIFLLGGGASAGFSWYKWYQVHKTPDLAYLDSHTELVAALAATIIPVTATPGAREALVHVTVIKMVKEVADRKTRNIFINGLKELALYTENEYDKPFTALTAGQQTAVVGYFRDQGKNYGGAAGKIKNRLAGKSFFLVLKEYTTRAFCTSQTGATETLAYNDIPGSWEACIPVTAGQRSWATK